MFNIPGYILKVLNILNNNGFEAYLVGGCVRDALMGIEPHDFDLTTNALPQEIIQCFHGMRIIETGLKHGTVTVVSDGENVEITTYRIDGKYTDNRHPEKVEFTRNIHEDLSRRDFTANAISYSPYDGIVDIFGGREDIKNKIIRCVGNPDMRFNEDGLRIIRAIRFSSVLSFEIDELTSQSIHKNKDLLSNISAERIYSELQKLICGKNAHTVLLEYSDIFFKVFPCLLEYKDIYTKNLGNIQNAPNDVISRFCILLNGMDKENIASSLRLLKPDNYFYKNVLKLMEYSDRKINYDEISVRYIMNDLNDENIYRLSYIKNATDKDFSCDKFISVYKMQLETGACVKIKDLDINGAELINLGFKKGKLIGDILDKLLQAVIENKCSNKKQELLKLAKIIGKVSDF